MRAIVSAATRHNGFNLLGGDADTACWGSNRGPASRELAAGVYGLSNQQLDTPWPKVRRSKETLMQWCDTNGSAEPSTEALFAILADRSNASDNDLPTTGVGLERERLLSAPFIVSPTYGTRNSTVLTIGHDGAVHWIERTFNPEGEQSGEVEFRFALKR